MDVGARILTLLEAEGISRHEFAERLHISYSTANGYILNRRLPDCEMLFHMADVLHSSSDYLIGRTNLRYYKDLNYAPKESLLVSNFRSLNPEMQQLLISISENMQQMQTDPSPTVAKLPFSIWDE